MEKETNLVVGIPSYNEADNIANVVRQVDLGLQKYFPTQKSVIINVDNNSPDNTKKAFLNTKTETPKIYISTPSDIKGKGNNLKNLFEKTIELQAEAGMIVDADIKSVTPEWVKNLLTPVLKKECDFVTPIYFREKTDGHITNHICHPLLLGILEINIRQPIGGDMAFSNKLVQHWLKQNWSEPVLQYGIDIFMTTEAIKGKFKICPANLGKKIHKPSHLKLSSMFLQVVETLFSQLADDWTPLEAGNRRFPTDLKKILPLTGWTKTLYDAFYAYATAPTPEQKQKIIKDLYIPFSKHATKLLSEKEIIEQANNFVIRNE